MKKFIFMIMFAFVVIAANAQSTIEKTNVLDNTYVGVNIGATTPLELKNPVPVNVTAGIKVGKWITPYTGFNVEGTAWFGSHDVSVSQNIVRATYVGLNHNFNLSELIVNNPKIDFMTEAGLGWIHQFNNGKDEDYLGAKTGLVINYNINKTWSVNVNPAVYWNLTALNKVHFNKEHAQLSCAVGVNYKFNAGWNYYNIKDYTDNIDALNAEINNLKAQLAKKPTVIEKKTVVEKYKVVSDTYVVEFAQNSSELTEDAKAVLNRINGSVSIVASASPEGTIEYNKTLSEERAEVIKQYLENRGVIVNSAVGIGAHSDSANRIAIIRL